MIVSYFILYNIYKWYRYLKNPKGYWNNLNIECFRV